VTDGASVSLARRSLQDARDDLEDAVRKLPELPGDSLMVTPALLALLLRVVSAKRHLEGVELTLAGSSPAWARGRAAPFG
jgi:hypothetical protein